MALASVYGNWARGGVTNDFRTYIEINQTGTYSNGIYYSITYITVKVGSGTLTTSSYRNSWSSSFDGLDITGAGNYATYTTTGHSCAYGSTISISAWSRYEAGSGIKQSDASLSYTVPRPTYTIYYNANGGNSTPSSQSKQHGIAITLRGAISRSSSTANGYTVYFNGNGGSVNKSSQTAINTTTYSFASWSGYAAGASYNGNATTTLYAQWNSSTSRGAVTCATASRTSSSSCVITIDANGGSSSVSSLSSSRTTSYTCTGWYTATSGGTKRASNGGSYTPSGSETLYAQWSSSTGSYGAVILPRGSQCTKPGYTLLGFSTDPYATSATYTPGSSYTPTGNITLYAIWTEADYSVMLYEDGTLEANNFIEVDSLENCGNFNSLGVVYAIEFIEHDEACMYIREDGVICAYKFVER